jgi:hypothetical protein
MPTPDMGVQTVQMKGRVLQPWYKKINPVWWLHGPDGWTVPTVNNGSPYLPDVTSVFLRRFYWFACRNPLMNFVGFVIGVEDRNYSVTGSAPVLRTTGRDCEPQQIGWRWAILRVNRLVRLPYISYWGTMPWATRKLEFYLGWRPHSGGFGLKIVFAEFDASQM